MFTKLIKRLFPAKQAEYPDADTKISALEKEVAELKALLEAQSQRSLTTIKEKDKTQAAPIPPKLATSLSAKESSLAEAAYFDMVEYFCNGHDDTAVDIIQYRHNGQEILRETFSWSNGCGEVTSEGIWKKANECAQRLILEGIPCREKK